MYHRSDVDSDNGSHTAIARTLESLAMCALIALILHSVLYGTSRLRSRPYCLYKITVDITDALEYFRVYHNFFSKLLAS